MPAKFAASNTGRGLDKLEVVLLNRFFDALPASMAAQAKEYIPCLKSGSNASVANWTGSALGGQGMLYVYSAWAQELLL